MAIRSINTGQTGSKETKENMTAQKVLMEYRESRKKLKIPEDMIYAEEMAFLSGYRLALREATGYPLTDLQLSNQVGDILRVFQDFRLWKKSFSLE